MKKLMFLFLAISFLAVGCKSDDEEGNILRYDGDNNSAPLLDADVYEAAARYTSTITSPYSGLTLDEVEFYLLDKPSTCALHIYGEGTATEPGPLLYNKDLTSVVNSNSWNSHVLSAPLEITGDDLWIAIEVSHIQQVRTVGCDSGPALNNGDWIYSSSNGQWETLRSFTGNLVNINWNIRGIVSEN